MQQTLVTSNGGNMVQCYLPFDSSIELASHLQMNLFTLKGEFAPDSNPFIFAASMRGGDVIPGTFYVEYEYDLKNPIGASWTYGSEPYIHPTDISVHDNVSVVTMEATDLYGPGTTFTYRNGAFFYENQEVVLPEELWITSFFND